MSDKKSIGEGVDTSDLSLDVIKKLVRSMREREGDIDEVSSPAKLKNLYSNLKTKNDFKPGDLVMWKPGLKDRKFPRTGEPAIVIEVLSDPVVDHDKEAGSHYFNQKYDIRLGIIQDGTLIDFYYQSERFEPYAD